MPTQPKIININNISMNRQFTRRRRDKGTQVNKRPAHTQNTKYGEKTVGLLRLLIVSDMHEGTFITRDQLLQSVYDRRRKFLEPLPAFLYQCFRRVEELEGLGAGDGDGCANMYANLLMNSNLFYVYQKNTWITTQHLSQKSLKFTFNKQLQKQIRPAQTFTLKQLPLKIQDYELFKGTPPIAVLNLGHRLIGMTVTTTREDQKQMFNYQLSSKVEKYVVQKDSLFVLLRNGGIVFGKMGEELELLDGGKAKYRELSLCGSDVLVLTNNYIIRILAPNGNPKKVIRAGVELSRVIPIYISTCMYVLLAVQGNKTCLLNCYKQGKNNYLQPCPEGLQKIEQTLYIGKWILLRTSTNKIYTLPLVKDSPVRVYEIYNGISPSMLKILHRKLVQA